MQLKGQGSIFSPISLQISYELDIPDVGRNLILYFFSLRYEIKEPLAKEPVY